MYVSCAALGSFSINIQPVECPKQLNPSLRWRTGRMSCIWWSPRIGHLMRCIKLQEFLLPICLSNRQGDFIGLSCSHVSEKIFGRTSGCILLFISLWKSVSTNLPLSLEEFYFLCVRYGIPNIMLGWLPDFNILIFLFFGMDVSYLILVLSVEQSRTCNLREAVILGSILQKVSIPLLHSRFVSYTRGIHRSW